MSGVDAPRYGHAGRTVVVTGGGSGIGRGLALAFAADGAAVWICGRRRDRLDAVAEAAPEPGAIRVAEADVRRFEDLSALAERAGKGDGVDVWVNNAGILERGTLPEADAEHLERQLETNVTGVWNGCRAAVAAMRARGGAILNVSSYLAEHAGATGGVPAYAASKGAVNALTRSLAVKHAPEGIRVNAICPALVVSELSPEIWRDHPDDAARARLGERYPLGRIGKPEDITGAALFLTSDAASWITGQTLFVDGGLSSI